MSMNLVPGTQRLTADGSVGTAGHPIRIFNIHLVSDTSTASQTSFNNGQGAGDTPFVQVDGTASKGVTLAFAGGFRFPEGAYMSANNLGYCTVTYTEEF